MAALKFTEIAVCGEDIHLFDMPDRRPGASSSLPVRWMFQMDLETVLYGNALQSTGAIYRLLQRTPGAKGRALCLRHRSTAVSRGLCSEAEWEAMVSHLHTGVRSLTLIPVDVAIAACATVGETKTSAALIDALGGMRPPAWDEDETGEETGEEEECEDGNEGDERDDSDNGGSDGCSGGHTEGNLSIVGP